MHSFNYKDGILHCEEVSVKEISQVIGTPFYLYSYATIRNHYRVFDSAFANIPHILCYSVKANSNLAILKILFNEGSGADVVSGGELYRALKAGVDPRKVVFSGVGKREDEIEFALSAGILMINVESYQELFLIDKIAAKLHKKAPLSLRVNPNINLQTHPYIATGLGKNKFGIHIDEAPTFYRIAKQLENISILGIDCHIGSQLISLEPFLEVIKVIKNLFLELKRMGIPINFLDLGGGLGIRYTDESPPHPKEYAKAIIEELSPLNCTLILEPGRVIMGNAGILVTKVLYTKKGGKKNFIVVDAGMNDLIRPSLYGASQAVVGVTKDRQRKIIADVVGPICESSDFFQKDKEIPDFQPGDLLGIMGSGAYGFSMSSNYNSRPRIPEVLVNGKDYFIIRERECYEDLIRAERIPDFLEKEESQ